MCINYDVIPERLQEYRKRLELTQQEMADLFSGPSPNITGWKTGNMLSHMNG